MTNLEKLPKVGWIGLGKMGKPMSKRLLRAGYSLTAYDIATNATNETAALGATIVLNPREVANQSDIVISIIPDDQALEEITLKPGGLFSTPKKKTIFVDMSTVSPMISERVAEAARDSDIYYLRAPVSGSTESAANATLTIMVSGPKKAFEQCEDIFYNLGQKVFHVGMGDEARYLKLLINIMVGISSSMTAEALAFGKRGGLDWDQMIDMINASVVASPLIGFKVQLLKERRFAPMFTAAQMAKDFDIALDTGRVMDIPLPLTAFTRQLYGAMKATGKGELDYFGLVTLIEEMAGIRD